MRWEGGKREVGGEGGRVGDEVRLEGGKMMRDRGRDGGGVSWMGREDHNPTAQLIKCSQLARYPSRSHMQHEAHPTPYVIQYHNP